MSRIQSIDSYWNNFSQDRAAIEGGRGMAAQGVQENGQAAPDDEMGFWGYTADIAKAPVRGIWGLASSIKEAGNWATGGKLNEWDDAASHAVFGPGPISDAPFGIESLGGHSETIPGGLLEGLSQVALPFGAGLRVVRGGVGMLGLRGTGTAATAAMAEEAVIAAAAGNTTRAAVLAGTSRAITMAKIGAEGAAAGALADMVAFSSWAPRLSDLALQTDNPMFNNALTQYLASDKDDGFLEGRLKNTIEGVFASAAIDTVFGAARVVRAGQRASRIGQDANSAMFAEHMVMRREHREQIMGATGASPDEAELINMVIDATGMSRSKLDFARDAVQEFDEAGNPRRAAVDFYDDGKTVIRFFEAADRSSPVHELSHVLRRRVLDRRIGQEFRYGITEADIKIIEDASGAKEGVWDVAAEENWASIFERFMWDGIAPNHRIAAVMERTANFMRGIYSRVEADEMLRNADPEGWAANGGTNAFVINPDVRRVMNKLMSRAPVTVDDAIRTFVKAKKKIAIPAMGNFYRTVLGGMDVAFDATESAQVLESVYREDTLYQTQSATARATGALPTDANYPVKRGRAAVIDRLQREVNQGKLLGEDGEKMRQLINALPPELVDVMGTRFRKNSAGSFSESKLGGKTLGQYSFDQNVVTIASDLIRSTKVRETWAHEWGHALQGFMSPEVNAGLKQDYTRAYQKFIRLEGVDPRAAVGTPEFDALKQWAGKNPQRWSEVYSLTDLDEWLSVGFSSAAWKQMDIQEGTRTYLGFARYAFHNLMLNIKSIWGGAVHERIARDLLDADFRASKQNLAKHMERFGLGRFAPKLLTQESQIFGNWEDTLNRQIDNRQSYMFRDFDVAENARTVGEMKKESLPYRVQNQLDQTMEMRNFPTEGPRKAPVSTVTLYQSTPEFKGWFKESKAVDEGGTPLVLHHGSGQRQQIFRGDMYRGETRGGKKKLAQKGKEFDGEFFFTTKKSLAETYMPPKETTYGIEGRDGYQYEGGLNRELASEILENDFTSRGMRKKLVSSTTQPNTRSFFLSVQNPLVIEAGGRSWNQLTAKDLPKSMSNRMESRGQTLGLTGFGDGPTKQILRLAKEFGHDGVLFRSVIDLGPSGKEYKAMSAAEKEAAVSDVWGVVDSRQIKSTENKGGFNPKVGSTLYQSASPPGTQRATRLTVNGKGLLNNQALDYAKLTDGEEAEIVQLLNYGLEQPRGVDSKAQFYFTDEGMKTNARLIQLLRKAAKGPVEETVVNAPQSPLWSSKDGQIAALASDVTAASNGGKTTQYQSALPTPPQLSPMGGKPPDRPFNIERMSTAADVRSYHDIRIQELEADGRVAFNSMSHADQIAAAQRELMQVADFTGYRTVPELTAALRGDEDALQGFMSRHHATRMMLSEAAVQLINAREAALTSSSRNDMARFIAMQQRVDVLLEHTRRNQATIARGLGAQNIIPGPGSGIVRLIDDTMLTNPQMVTDIIDASGGEAAVRTAMEVSRAAEVRGGQAGAIRASQGGRGGVIPVLTEYWMNSILSGPITFAVNATSNTAAMLYSPLEQALGASLTRNFPLVRESMMRYGTLVTSIKESMIYAGVALKTGDNILDRGAANILGGNTSTRDRAISAASMKLEDNTMLGGFVNFLGTVINAPGSALGATDEFFKQMNYRSTVKAGLIADAMQEVANGRITKDQMGQWVEDRFQRMVEQGQFYSERKVRGDANNAAQREIAAGTFTEGSQEHADHLRQFMRDNWDAGNGALANRARETAREATYTNPLRPDREGIEGMSAKVQVLVGQHPSLRILLPFIRTPTNLILYFGQRTPITGIMYATPGLNQTSTRFSRDIASGDPVRRAQAIGRIAGGTMITMSAIVAAGTGVITGSGPKDPEERAYLMKAGWQPYSIKVGNTYVSYKKMDPFATFFGIAADLHQAYAESDDANKSAIEVTLKGLVTAVANNIAQKTYLTGIVSASNAISDAGRYGPNWLEQFVGSFVPSALAQSQQIFGEDPVMRDVQTLKEAIFNRIPGLSSSVAPRRDILGEPIRRGKILGAVPLAWPFSYTQVNHDVVAKELAQLGAGFTPPRSMRNDVDMRAYVNGRGQNSYDRWQQLTGEVPLGGRTLRESMEQLIESPMYQRLDPTSVEGYESPRVPMIRKLISRYRDAAFRETMTEFPDLMEAERNRRAAVIGADSGKPFAELLQYSRDK